MSTGGTDEYGETDEHRRDRWAQEGQMSTDKQISTGGTDEHRRDR